MDERAGRRLDGLVYGLDVEHFLDADGDGHGDLRGVAQKLGHVAGLGATHLWLLPFYPHNERDNGYDVTDHFAVDPAHGTMADLLALLEAAHRRGLRVLVDLVVNHTSDTHPWFRRARADPRSPQRGYYLWRRRPPPRGRQREPVFPTVEPSVWTRDRKAGAYYHHTYYRSQPDLNLAHPDVRDYAEGLVRFWLRVGVDGFRLDSINHVVEPKDGHAPPGGARFLERLRRAALEERPGAVVLGEADEPPAGLRRMFGGGRRVPALLNFYLDSHAFLALARQRAEPIVRALRELPRRPPGCQWLNCLRNLDELDLERLTPGEQEEVYAAFAPRKGMRAYGRGVRRRLAPMMGDPRRLRMAHALLFSLPGVPLLAYGDEIGMGDDLRRREREAVRIPMQWTAGRNAGFSAAPAGRLAARPVLGGPFGARKVNVEAQRRDPRSLLALVRRLARLRTRLPDLAQEDPAASAAGDGRVLCLRYPSVLCLANLSGQDAEVQAHAPARGRQLAERARPLPGGRLRLGPYGFAWLQAPGRSPYVGDPSGRAVKGPVG